MNLLEYLKSNGGSKGSFTGFNAEFSAAAGLSNALVNKIAGGRSARIFLKTASKIVKASNGAVSYEDLLQETTTKTTDERNVKMKKMLTAKDVSEWLNLSTKTVLNATRDGKLKGLKIGGVWRFEKANIQLWING